MQKNESPKLKRKIDSMR